MLDEDMFRLGHDASSTRVVVFCRLWFKSNIGPGEGGYLEKRCVCVCVCVQVVWKGVRTEGLPFIMDGVDHQWAAGNVEMGWRNGKLVWFILMICQPRGVTSVPTGVFSTLEENTFSGELHFKPLCYNALWCFSITTLNCSHCHQWQTFKYCILHCWNIIPHKKFWVCKSGKGRSV